MHNWHRGKELEVRFHKVQCVHGATVQDQTDLTDQSGIQIITEELVQDRIQLCVVSVSGCKKLNYKMQTENSSRDYKTLNVPSMYSNGPSRKRSVRNY